MNPEFTPTPSPAPDEAELLRQREALRRGLRRANFAWVVIVAVIAALAFGVVWKAGQSAREAERANHHANQAAQEAARANAEAARAEAELWNARFTEARALRQTGGPGARGKSSRIVTELVRHPNLTEQQRLALRSETIAQFALVDVDLPANMSNRLIKGQAVWDANFERYALSLGTNDVEIFESSSSNILTTLPVPRGFNRNAVVFSPDGQYLAGVFKRNSSRVLAWRLESGALVVSNLTISAGGYHKPFFSPDGRMLAIYTAGALELHRLDTSAPPHRLPKPSHACFSPDSKNLAVALQTNVEIWSVATGDVQARVSLDFKPFTVAWHPDRERLAVGGSEGELALWELPVGGGVGGFDELRRLQGHAGTVVTLQFSADGRLLLSSAWDGFSSLWELKSGRRLLAETRVSLGQLSADGRRVVVEAGILGQRSVVPLLGRVGFRTVLHSGRLRRHATGVAFSRDGRFAATDYHEVTRVWDTVSGRELARIPGRSPVFLPDHASLLACTERGVLRFDVEAVASEDPSRLEGVEILHRNRALHPEDAFNSLSLAPDDRTLVIASSGAGVVLFDLAEERPLRRLTNVVAHYASVTKDGDWLMTQAHNDRAYLVSLTNTAHPRLIGWHLNTAFSPDGKRLALSTEETLTLAGRNATNGWSRTLRIPLALGAVASAQLAFSPDSRHLAVNTNRFDVHLLDAASGQTFAAFAAPFDTPVGGGGRLTFSPDGRFLRALRQDGEVVEWDIPVVRGELAKLGLDWDDRGEATRFSTQPSTINTNNLPSFAAPNFTASSLSAMAAGAAGLLALVAGVFVFVHQRKLLAGYAQAERLAAERQQQLGQAQDALFQSQKMEALGTLAAGVAHDFNNLLSIIRMSKQLVDRAVKPEGVTKENLAAIEQAVQQGKSLVNSMLGYSRRPTEAIEDFSVVKVVGDTVALLSRQFLGGLTLNLQLDQSCPPIHGSRARLEQALLNLIVNASEAMKGSGALTIKARPLDSSAPAADGVLQSRAVSAGVELSVIDTGPGIAPDALPRIFEPFFTTKTIGTQRGTGLGLSLVYAIAKQDGWGLGVQTAPGGGTTFTLVLPATQTALSGRRLPTSQGADVSGRLNDT